MNRLRFEHAAGGTLPWLLVLALLAGCGQKGPLFVPEPGSASTAPTGAGTTESEDNGANEDGEPPPAAPPAVP